jgi:hypothetical protein
MRKLLLIATISLSTVALAAPANGSFYDPSPAEGHYGQTLAKHVDQSVAILNTLQQAKEASATSSSYGEVQPGAMASNEGVSPYQQVITSQYQLNSCINGLR